VDGDKEEILYSEGGEALAQVAQRGGRCPTPGNLQGQVGRSNLIQLKISLLMVGGLDWMSFKGPFQPKPFWDSATDIVELCGQADQHR